MEKTCLAALVVFVKATERRLFVCERARVRCRLGRSRWPNWWRRCSSRAVVFDVVGLNVLPLDTAVLDLFFLFLRASFSSMRLTSARVVS